MASSSSPTLLLLLLPFVLVLAADGGRVLVFPGEYSHWLNMRSIMDELVKRNHSVTVMVSDASPSVNYNDSRLNARFNFTVFKVPFSRAEIHGLTEDFIQFVMYESHSVSALHRVLTTFDWVSRSWALMKLQCDSMLKNKQLMMTLRQAAFDVVLLDPISMCADLVADMLDLPFIVSIRFSLGGAAERLCGQAVAPPSYVPAAPLPYSDRMTFVERLINTVTYVSTSVVTELLWRLSVDSYYSEVKGSPSTVCRSLGKADFWFIRTFWDIETPRPIQPNFKYVGGLHCKPANQLPEEMEAFVRSAGDAGVVVVSFGSMVADLTTERADVVAAALGRLPQKVIWRYSGPKPNTLATNTKLYSWIPQNDLLGHPQTRVFVTHGGMNGVYEAVFHAVPLVAIPLFGDQPDNVARLERHGAAAVLHFNTMTSEQLEAALRSVINQPTYKANMLRLSKVHRDRPLTALHTAVFWVEFVMRHGGAPHLRPASHDLNWLQYHGLDVVAALLVAMTTAVTLCRCGLRRCGRRRPLREKIN